MNVLMPDWNDSQHLPRKRDSSHLRRDIFDWRTHFACARILREIQISNFHYIFIFCHGNAGECTSFETDNHGLHISIRRYACALLRQYRRIALPCLSFVYLYSLVCKSEVDAEAMSVAVRDYFCAIRNFDLNSNALPCNWRGQFCAEINLK